MKKLNQIIISRVKLPILLVITFSFAFLLVDQTFACGPFFPNYIYTPEDIEKKRNPFLFVDPASFLNSHYEIILSNWNLQAFYPIYRDLTNNKISQEEKEQLVRYYNYEFYDIDQQLDEAIASWKEARKLIAKEDVEIDKYKCDDYNCYVNCLPDAFLTAANTLKERSKVYNSDELKIWLDNQDKVFSNCGTQKSVGFKLSALPASLQESTNIAKNQSFLSKVLEFFLKIFNKITNSFKNLFTKKITKPEEKISNQEILKEEKISNQELLRYDQEYQRAALAFYQGNLDEAEKIFKEIADNPNHPWRAYGALALARIYIRRANEEYEKNWPNDNWEWESREKAIQARNAILEKAKIQLENILKDNSLNSVHEGARSLLNFVNFRIDPKKRFKEAEEILLTLRTPKEIINNLEDFSLLLPEMERDYILKNGKDLSQWIYIYVWGGLDQSNLEFALEQYQKTKSLHWLLASLKLMTPEHHLRDEIIKESLKIPKDSPVYLSANYYRLKLLIKMGENMEKIRKDIDSILATIPEEYPIAKNYFNNLRMLTAKNLTESLSYSLRRVLAVETDSVSRVNEKGYLIDGKIKQLFNEFLPLEKWTEIVLANDIFPAEITKQIRLVAFVRAVLLDDFESAQRIASILASSDPTLKEDLSDFLKAKNYNEKKFTAAFFILKYYRLNHVLDSRLDEILVNKLSVKEKDINQRNWWCPYDQTSTQESYEIKDLMKFISSQEIQKAKLENEKIYKIVAPNYLSEIVINYALENPNDPRIPEALHLAVMSTRFSECKDDKTSEFSQKAFQILHNNYPNNYWTKQTPYWY